MLIIPGHLIRDLICEFVNFFSKFMDSLLLKYHYMGKQLFAHSHMAC